MNLKDTLKDILIDLLQLLKESFTEAKEVILKLNKKRQTISLMVAILFMVSSVTAIAVGAEESDNLMGADMQNISNASASAALGKKASDRASSGEEASGKENFEKESEIKDSGEQQGTAAGLPLSANGDGSLNNEQQGTAAGLSDMLTVTTAKSAKDILKPDKHKEEEIVEGRYYAISVNGEDILLVNRQSMAEEILNSVAAEYLDKGATLVSTSFKEDVSIHEFEAPVGTSGNPIAVIPYFENTDEAVSFVLLGTTEPKTYTVVKGDTLWGISQRMKIDIYELQDMNKQLNPDRIQIGDIIYLYERHQFMTAVITEEMTKTESIPFSTTYELTDSLYNGQYKVKSAGVNGSREVVHEYVKENGVLVSDAELSSSIISEPVTQVSYQGTATLQIRSGSGVLQSPVSPIKVNSEFGAARRGHRHAGVDLGGFSGQNIMAADDGTVIFSGWGGSSYGNIVKIDHGNGIQTYYAHCSSMAVSYGDDVKKGQVIAYIGRTGNATGYLCHFEVRVNGVAKNPLDYI